MASASEVTPLDKRYTQLTPVGSGGMGVVYRAKDRLTDQVIALKSILGDYASKQSEGTAFDRRLVLAEEFQTLAGLRHPNIISVIDFGFDLNQQPYFTMDLLQDAQPITYAGLRQPVEHKLDLLTQALQALVYLHRRGIVHRDLKPGNILVQNGQVKLLDFGLATTQQQVEFVVGTPAYIAPEVLLGGSVTPASDLYAIGVILYEMFTNRHPFDTTDFSRLLISTTNTNLDLTPFATKITQGRSSADSAEPTVVIPADPSTIGRGGTSDTVILPASQQIDPKTIIVDARPTGRDEAATDQAIERFRDIVPAGDGIAMDPAISLAAVVRRLLNRNSAIRYNNAEDVIRDLSIVMGKPLSAETSMTRDSFLKAAKFVGRQQELTQFLNTLSQAFAKAGSVWLVNGEGGVGKSRFLEELRIRALVKGALVLRATAAELDAPYQLWRDLLRRLLLNIDVSDYDAGVLKEIIPNIDELLERPVQLAPALEPEQGRKRILSVIMNAFSQQKQPMLIVLEDLHCARAENLSVLEQLAQVVAGLPLLVVGSYRSDEKLEIAPTLRGLPTVTLKRFAAADTADLTASILGDGAQSKALQEFLHNETEGNVLFIIEVIRALADQAGKLGDIKTSDLPTHLVVEGIQQLLQRRLDRIPATDRDLLQIAALVGREVDLRLLHAAQPAADLNRWLLTCSDAAVLEVSNERWQFSHDKLRQAVQDGIADKPQTHRTAAELIEKVYPGAADYAQLLVSLWATAGDRDKERGYAIVAGEQAYQASAYQDATRYFQRALALLAQDHTADTEQQRSPILVALAKCEVQLNNYERAVQLAEESIALKATLSDPALHSEALYALGYSLLYKGDAEHAAPFLEQSLTRFREQNNLRGASDALRGLARIDSAQGNYAAASKFLEESLTNSQQANNQWSEATAYMDLGYAALMQGQFGQADAQLEQASQLFRTVKNQSGIANSLLLHGMTAHFSGNDVQSTAYLMESLAISRAIGDQRAAAGALNNLGSYASERGDYSEAERWLAQSLQAYRDLKFRWGIAATLVNLGHAASGQSQTTKAKQYFADAMREANDLHAAPLILEVIAGSARLLAAEGDQVKALEWIGLVDNHPAMNPDVQSITAPLLTELSAKLSAPDVQQGIDSGRKLVLEDVVAIIMTSGTSPNLESKS